jgi:two-component system, OmpR family, sensor histidine kinase VicK
MINIEFRQPSKNIPAVQLDVDKFRIAAANIIENAILYTPKNGHVTVVVSRDQKKSILFYVQDSGIGISQKEIPLIFTRFFRGRQASSLNMNGSGLGLFIAKNIIEKHGGKIWVESEIDKGTTVYFTIPIK